MELATIDGSLDFKGVLEAKPNISYIEIVSNITGYVISTINLVGTPVASGRVLECHDANGGVITKFEPDPGEISGSFRRVDDPYEHKYVSKGKEVHIILS